MSTSEGSFFYVLDEPARILLADDDPILREFAVVHLSTDVARLTTAADGVEALQCLEQESFDLILLDLDMPRMDGFEVLKRLRDDERFRHTPVIVETGREDVVAIDRAFGLGATSFVVKPINWRLLSYQIRFVLRAARSERALRQARARLHDRYTRSADAARALLEASAIMLEMAKRSDGPMRQAAAQFAERLDALRDAAPDPAAPPSPPKTGTG